MAPARQSIKPGVTLAGAAVEKSAPCYDPIGLASGPSTGSRSAPVLAVATSTMPTAQSETLRLAALDRTNVTWQNDLAVSRALVARLRAPSA